MSSSRALRAVALTVLPTLLAVSSCGGGSDGGGNEPPPQPTGGVAATGGQTSTGGVPASGGSITTGGVTSGGSSATGGAPPAGGSGGASAGSGGVVSTTGGASVAGGGNSAVGGGGTPPEGGTAGSGGETAGSGGGGAAAMLKGPILRSGKGVLEFGDIYFEVDPAIGARVLSTKLGTQEVLSSKSVASDNYGSTFWTAPQYGAQGWSWPPIAEIDTAAYTAMEDGMSFVAVGQKVPSADRPESLRDLSVTKKFTPDFAKNAIVIDYTIKNEGTSQKQLAPWEITRVAGGGLTFFVADAAPFAQTGEGEKPLTTTTSSEGAYWFDYPAGAQPETKLLANGKGWVAHVTPNNVILIKTFADITDAQVAPGESEIELYTNNAASTAAGYVEVENQGAYTMIPAGGMSTWTVRWYLRTLPDGVTAAPSKALLDFVTTTIQP